MDVTNQSIDPKSSEGENISNIEKERIHRAIREVEEKMARLKLSIK
jgi:predicted amidohydrolase